MADLYSRNVNTKFTGLTTTVALFAVVGTIALVGFESLRQVRRLPRTRFAPFWRKNNRESLGGRGGVDPDGDDRGGNVIGTREKLSCEDWEMGHLYLARQFHAITPSPPMARWPLAWAYQALKIDDWFYATHTGMDTVVYVRFLRACMWWLLLQTLTTAPILLAIHFHFAVKLHSDTEPFIFNGTEVLSPSGPISLNDMSQASLSYLVTTTICLCANGTYSQSPCNDGTSTSDSKTSTVAAFRNCDHVPNAQGRKLLWVHLVLLWYITFTWFYALWWIGRGSLLIRRRWVEKVREVRQEAVENNRHQQVVSATSKSQDDNDGRDDIRGANESRQVLEEKHGIGNLVRGDDHDGWRQRTLLVTNLPPTMRDEASIRRYFEEFLRPDDASSIASADDDNTHDRQQSKLSGSAGDDSKDARSDEEQAAQLRDESFAQGAAAAGRGEELNGPEPDINPDRHFRSPVQTVVLVRKMNELSAMLSRRQEVLSKLEAAHIRLAQSVMSNIGQNTKAMRKESSKHGGSGGLGGLGVGRTLTTNSRFLRPWKRPRDANGQKMSAEDIERSAAEKASEDRKRLDELTRRLARFSPDNRGKHIREAQTRAQDELGGNEMTETVWEALSEVPRELLDPYQPVTRLSSLFRGQKVPTIDYLLTKLNLLTALVTEMRARPPSSYEATSTAFVTFRDPRQARMVWRELKTQIVVKVRLAPEVKDLDWERLMRTSFTGDIVRGLGVNVFFWAFTILWVIPVALLTTSLFSVEKLEGVFPALQAFFRNNPRFEGFISVTLPTIIVALLTLAVPELIFQISKRAQGFVTFSALYDQCLCRYWKFIICNVVIFFCIGATTVQSIIFQLGTSNNVLNAVAFAFPTAAPFYISYLILGLGVHTGFELVGFMVPLIQHMGARNALTPRVRALKTLPRNFNRYYWLPLHILIMSIVFLFALLNPLVIPFGLVYSWLALAVFKKNFAYQYFRRFNEKEGVVYYMRLLRFSLDGLLVAQIVLLIFFSVTRQEAAYIALTAVLLPINVAVKLLGTRLWKSQCRAIEDEEANALCGIGTSAPMTPSVQRDYVGQDSMYGASEQYNSYASPLDARASGRYPAVIAAPPTSSRLANAWNKIHESFSANGHDRPKYMIGGGHGQHVHGSRVNAKTVTQAVASAPIKVARRTALRSRRLADATSAVTQVPASGFKMRQSLALSSAFPSRNSESKAPMPTDQVVAGASTRDLKLTLEGGEEAHNKIKALAARRSTKSYHRRRQSDEAPFLSGYEAIANHAPVIGSEDDSMHIYDDDGEFEEYLGLQRRETFVRQKRRRSQVRRSVSLGRSASTNLVHEGSGGGYTVMDERMFVADDPLGAHYSQQDRPFAKSHSDTGFYARRNDRVSDVAEAEESEAIAEAKAEEDENDDDSVDGGPLVRPHARVRWDDTPNNHARYNNPFYSVELDPFLWLPRDPLAPVDLCDTIEWHGAALVSSQGGQGRVGEWDDEEEDESFDEKETAGQDGEDGDDDEEEDDVEEVRSHKVIRVGPGLPFALQGNEKIAITGTLAQRLQEAEDAESVQNPAASVPRNQMDDYKRALDEDAAAVASDEEGEGDADRSPRIRSPRRRASTRRRSSVSAYELPVSAHTQTSPRLGGDASLNVPTPTSVPTPSSPTSPAMQRWQSLRREHRRASNMTGGSGMSADGVGDDSTEDARPARVTMRQALKAEVMEEEYLRTVKERVARQSRRSENTSTLSTTLSTTQEVNEDEAAASSRLNVAIDHAASLHGGRSPRQTHLTPRKWTTLRRDGRQSGAAGGTSGAGVMRSMSSSTFASTAPSAGGGGGGQNMLSVSPRLEATGRAVRSTTAKAKEEDGAIIMDELRRSPTRMSLADEERKRDMDKAAEP